MGKFGSFGKTIAFSLLIIFLAIDVVAFFAAFISRHSNLMTTNVDAIVSSIEAAAEKAANPEPRICPYCGVVAKGEETQCLSCGGTLPPSPVGANVVSNSEEGPCQVPGDVRGGKNLFVSQTEVICGDQQTVAKRVVKCTNPCGL